MAKRKSGSVDASHDALLAELAALRSGSREAELARLVNELQIHQEELHAQQLQFFASQQELEETRDAYADLFAFAPIGYIVLETSGVIREANLAAATMLGVERRFLSGHPLFAYVKGPERRAILDHIARCRRGEAHVTTEVTLLSRDGRAIPVQLSSSPARRNERDLFLTTIVDFSERKRAEDERARAREIQQRATHEEQLARAASEAKDRFIAMLSHELRTPLTPILLALEVIQRGDPLPDALSRSLDMIHRNVQIEARLIDDLLDVSRIVQGKLRLAPELVSINTLVSDTLEMFAGELDGAELRVSTSLLAVDQFVRVDPARLRQVLWNLLQNAIRNTPAGGEVSIVTENPRDRWITVSVRDTGRGIAPDVIERMFNLFEQGDEAQGRGAGLGLGLPISKGLIEAHGGRMNAASAGRNRGACLTIELPTMPAPAQPAPAAQAQAQAQAQARRVLLVEDNEDSAAALAELLRLHGYEVHVASSVREAMRFVDQVDLVISDIGLPDGSGYELMREISARRAIPAIALSGYGSTDDHRRSAEAGFDRHLVKPVEPRHLLEILQNLGTEPSRQH